MNSGVGLAQTPGFLSAPPDHAGNDSSPRDTALREPWSGYAVNLGEAPAQTNARFLKFKNFSSFFLSGFLLAVILLRCLWIRTDFRAGPVGLIWLASNEVLQDLCCAPVTRRLTGTHPNMRTQGRTGADVTD